ncbi:glucuronate isomerase [Jannaschia seohaensis]|uniref:Uronate isomerase n=1 Tax=Jannaschia seohaensis TaxID=475081 RepID=A0A2Y9B2D9_9RHOB|nr:glucuronate isomerase [Jannaschia seohaensis]PWJ16142.1 glucuronate isomerase [Jannaschia seohaensis]SSA49127.1 glucuronate isomerase [Jannaschia seohaensis]
MTDATLHPDRLFPPDPGMRAIARALYESVADLPIVSPHGHTDPAWWGTDAPFANAAELFVTPDHYVTRMLVSQGVPFEAISAGTDPRAVWSTFAAHYHLFAATPSRLWIDHAFQHVFGLTDRLGPDTADRFYDAITEALATDAFRPRALYERFGIAAIATTDSPLSDLTHHARAAEDWPAGRVLPTYRPDDCVDPEHPGFRRNVETLGALTGCDTTRWQGYLEAHRKRRAYFAAHGATATDHGHPTAQTRNLPEGQASAVFQRVLRGHAVPGDAETFRAQMLTEMARMSVEDGLVMQLHAGSSRNHSDLVFRRHGRDRGFDIPARTDYVAGLRPLLNAVGMDPRLTLILFTLDESTYARELAPLAGAYPSLLLGPPWWFHDSPEGMRRYRERVTETAGFHNTAGFNDDTRALCSIPARHDMARRADCAFLATLVADHRLSEAEAHALAPALATGLARKAYKL